MRNGSEDSTGPRQGAVTIGDIAERAGTSRATVSRHLNGGRYVSSAAAQAIQRAIEETGYRASSVARSLRGARSDTVAFLLPASIDRLFADPVYAVLVKECSAQLSRRGQSMVMLMADDEAEQARTLDYLRSGHVDGVITTGLSPSYREMIKKMPPKLPVVAASRPDGLGTGLSTVFSDGFSGMREVGQYLHSQGRSRVAFIGAESDPDGRFTRLEGLEAGLGSKLDPELVHLGDITAERGADAAAHLVEVGGFDALVASNDVLAAAAIGVLRQAGIRIPEDVAVVGFDNVEAVCLRTDPPLTSVSQDFPRIAAELVRLLEAQMAGAGQASVMLPTKLIKRGSA